MFKKIDALLLRTRFLGTLLIISSIVQFVYFAQNANQEYPVFASLFLIAILVTIFSTIISVINSWYYSKPTGYVVREGYEPTVGVLIPCYGEPVEMIKKTIFSVMNQNWPKEELVIVVSDDGKNPILENEVVNLSKTNANIYYFRPPSKNSEFRRGEGKSGNLNAALRFLLSKYPDLKYIETRDADDLATKDFLKIAMGSMLANNKLSFVQTIKRSIVSKGDPFLNQEKLFYERTMRYRAAVNSVFPCGSGVVWRVSHLIKINAFPSWNLVEDLQSGVEVLNKKGTGEYLPFVGAIGQTAPEDIPNYYKQRGTWAIDALRLFFWKNAFFVKGLNIWQKLQFFELGFSYMLSLVMFFFIYSISACLGFSVCPATSNSPNLLLISGLFIVLMEFYNISRARGISYKEIWNVRQTWIGLLPIFVVAVFKTLFYGPNNKPTYKVTRKSVEVDFYWKDVGIQLSMMLILAFSVISKLTNSSTFYYSDFVLIFWALFLIYGFSRVIINSWYGVSVRINLTTNLKTHNQSPVAA